MPLSGVRGQSIATGRSFCDSVPMSLDVGGDPVETAVFRLGPVDGQEHSIETDTDELSIVMSDGQQHRYVRTDEVQPLPDGRLGVVFDWTGRYYGPK
jgi:hypothetical protein